ncbi:MAG: hypothetical protein ACKO47_05915 [Alphaproteobacteria bacterium]
MQIFTFSSNAFLFFCLLTLQLLCLKDSNTKFSFEKNTSFHQKNHQNSSNSNTEPYNNLQITEEKNDSENNNDNFEKLKLALANNILKKFIKLKEKFSNNLPNDATLTTLAVPTSPPNFC